MAHIEFSTFKGKPVMSIKPSAESRYGITFGLKKAEMILESIPEIQEFVKRAKQAEMEAGTDDEDLPF